MFNEHGWLGGKMAGSVVCDRDLRIRRRLLTGSKGVAVKERVFLWLYYFIGRLRNCEQVFEYRAMVPLLNYKGCSTSITFLC